MKMLKIERLVDEIAQAWTVTVKDIRVYYLKSGMIMFGFLMPLFMFFSFSVKRELALEQGMAQLLALTVFFTAAAAGPFIIPLERRLGTYDRLLAAPMSLITLLIGKAAVGAIFAIGVSVIAVLGGWIVFGIKVSHPGWLIGGVALSAFSFSTLGLIFGSIPTRSPGDVQMPSTLLRWGLLFISGVFIPVEEMAPALRTVAYLSPLTYAQDLMHFAVQGEGLFQPWVNLFILAVSCAVFFIPSIRMHRRSLELGY